MKTGIELIAAERERQIIVEGRTPSRDLVHDEGELAHAAVGYASLGAYQSSHHLTCPAEEMDPHPDWPWVKECWKPSNDPIRNLVRAGALIAAEIDRLRFLDGPRPHARSTDAYPDGCECDECWAWDAHQAKAS